ncbi:hypothetical protein [Leptodesmis sp.]|uniref:hypothetical protein n=1 Tax=Leptodesmis sp. TaxID=3100501 RepID=UPI0040534C84
MKRFLRLLIVFLLTASLIVNPVALSRSQVPSGPVASDNGVPVMLDGKTLFLIRAPFASTYTAPGFKVERSEGDGVAG